MKAVNDFDISEVCIFVMSLGLSAKVDAFRQNSIDGDMIVTLTAEDLQNDLGLTSLQAKKVVKQVNILQGGEKQQGEDSGGGGGGGGNAEWLNALQQELQVLEDENAALKAQLQKFLAPAPPPHHCTTQRLAIFPRDAYCKHINY
jgi:SAM domain (Sterile alpha motif)